MSILEQISKIITKQIVLNIETIAKEACIQKSRSTSVTNAQGHQHISKHFCG